MINSRQILVTATGLLALIGIAAASLPFLKSMAPAKHLPEHTTDIDISTISPESYKLIPIRKSKKIENPDGSTSWHSGDSLFLVKDSAANIYLYYLPIWEDKIMMPYRHWGQHEGYCQEFVADFSDRKKPTIGCKDSDWADFLTKQWKWSIEGKNLGEDLPDLIAIRYKHHGNEIEAFYR